MLSESSGGVTVKNGVQVLPLRNNVNDVSNVVADFGVSKQVGVFVVSEAILEEVTKVIDIQIYVYMGGKGVSIRVSGGVSRGVGCIGVRRIDLYQDIYDGKEILISQTIRNDSHSIPIHGIFMLENRVPSRRNGIYGSVLSSFIGICLRIGHEANSSVNGGPIVFPVVDGGGVYAAT